MRLEDLIAYRDMQKHMINHLHRKGDALSKRPNRFQEDGSYTTETIRDIVTLSVTLNKARHALYIVQYEINKLLTTRKTP